MGPRKPTPLTVVALLILLLGIAAGLSLMGWYASGIGSNAFNIPGTIAMAGGLIAIVILCVGLCSVVFNQRPAGQSRHGPATPSKPPEVEKPQRRQEPVGKTIAKPGQGDLGDSRPT